ncbi:MAG: 2Fe-2S iron-sulfur cluster binding domain-containing protein [Bacteroidetes bacterium]|nr:2Fe-2S iron-sulfur cluster binding domain-containing protein [Bacteroidota bacterium]
MIYLFSLLVMNGLIVFILILLILIKRYIAVYDDYSITINGEKAITVHGGETVTASLAKNKIFLPSACGGKGTCGLCQVRVVEGLTDPLSIEEAVLPYKDIVMGNRLGCQTKIRGDMKIEIPEEYLSVQEYRGSISKIETLTHDINRFDINLIEPKELEFKSGQYVVVEPVPGETRAYSIASIRKNKDKISLEVKKIPNGICSTYIHGLKEKDELIFFGPYGEFYLRQTSHKVICVAGGVGLAPMKSIINEVATEHPERQVELYYGARTIDDMYDYEKYISLSGEFDNFKFYPALSDVEEVLHHPSGFIFDTGFINNEIAKRLTDGDDCEAYLCGPPVMINACIQTLIAKGVPEDRIFYDKF